MNKHAHIIIAILALIIGFITGNLHEKVGGHFWSDANNADNLSTTEPSAIDEVPATVSVDFSECYEQNISGAAGYEAGSSIFVLHHAMEKDYPACLVIISEASYLGDRGGYQLKECIVPTSTGTLTAYTEDGFNSPDVHSIVEDIDKYCTTTKKFGLFAQ